jgi:hypothetical protein
VDTLIADLYRKLGFSAARRTNDDLAEVFRRFLDKPRRHGSELGQLLAHARDTEQVRERLATEGVADVDAFFAGTWSSKEDGLGDLVIERFLVRDMDQRERAAVAAALEQSLEARQLLDRLLKQRLIFLADYPAEPFAERVAALLAERTLEPPRHARPSLRRMSVAAAVVAAAALLGVGILTQTRSPASDNPPDTVNLAWNGPALEVDAEPKAEPTQPVAEPEPEPEPEPLAEPEPERLAEPEPERLAEPEPEPLAEPEPEPATRERGNGARIITYARAGGEVRQIEDGDRIDDDERVVAWVKTDAAGYAAVISVGAERTRIFAADRGKALKIPAGGPTRLGKGQTLPDDTELVLLVSPEPFEVRPIVQRMRRGAAPTTVFDGTVRRTHVRLAPTQLAAGQ